MSHFYYRTNQLTIQSSFPLSPLFLKPIPNPDQFDISIIEDSVPSQLPDAQTSGPLYEATPTQLLLTLPNIARYWVKNKDQIIIQKEPTATDSELALFLLNSILPFLLHQRKIPPFNCSAILIDKEAILFLGPSASGKSTLAVGFHQAGFPILSDQRTTVHLQSDHFYTYPENSPSLLWTDVLKPLGLLPTPQKRVRPTLNKYAFSFSSQQLNNTPYPIKAIYILSPQKIDTPSIELIPPSQQLIQLMHHTYHKQLLIQLKLQPYLFQTAAQLIQKIPIKQLNRPESPYFKLQQSIELILQDITQ